MPYRQEYNTRYQQQSYVKERKRQQLLENSGENEIRRIKESTPCVDCKKLYPACVMDFDHLPGYEKSFNISQSRGRGKTKEQRLAEIEKCELVCSNCHRIRTEARRVYVEGIPKFTNKPGQHNRIKTNCKFQHEFTEENTWIQVDKNGVARRRCRECMRTRTRQRRMG